MTGRVFRAACCGICIHFAVQMASASVLVEYNFSGLPGDQITTPASWTATGLTATAIRRGPGLEALAGAGLMNSRAWTMGEIDRELEDLSAQFDLDDDALLGMISNLISN